LGESLGHGNIQAVFTSAYGGYATKDSYLEAVLSYTRNQYENSRYLSVGSITEQVYGNHGGETFSSYLRVGRYFQMGGGALLEPFAGMEYTRLYEEGFRESGAEGINLRIADRRVNSLTGEVGLRLSGPVDTGYGRLVPEISASWGYDFKIGDRRIDASFADSPGSEFSIPDQDPARHTGRLRAGLSFLNQKGLSASVHYDGEFSRQDGGHAIFGFLRYEY
jgi:outer membrane autotransporter protein